MSRRIGDFLVREVPLTRLDVEEVLAEQSLSSRAGQSFGQVALELGLCSPEHVWKAWAAQLRDGPREIDIDEVGIDAQALYMMPADIAIEYGVVPVRFVSDTLIVAASPDRLERAQRDLPSRLGTEIRFALASENDISRAIEVCYLPFQAHC